MFRSRLLTRIAVSFCMFCAFFLAGCGSKNVEDAMAESIATAIDVQVTQARRAGLKRETEFSGRVESGTSVNIYAEVPAKILNVYKNAGEYVQAGELLMEVDDADVQNALASAQAGLSSAQLALEQTKAQQAVSTSGSGYIAKQMSNEKTLTDLIDKYYDTLRSGKQLDNTLDEYTARYWDATSARVKAEKAFDTVKKDMPAASDALYGIDSDGFIAKGVDKAMLRQYVSGTASSAVSLSISEVLQSNPALSTKVNALERQYAAASGALASSIGSETQMKTALETYEKQYDSSASTIDSTIRDITKNYDYYAKTIGVSETLGRSETGALNALTVATMQISCENAQRGVDTATRNLEKCKLYAPVSGTIITKNAVVSNFANSAQPMFVIAADDTAPQIAFNLSEAGAEALTVGSTVTVVLNGTEYTATITEIANAATTGSGLYAAKAVLPADAGIERTGAVVTVRAATAQTDNAVILPLSYIQYDGNQAYVLLYENGKAVRRDLTLGMTTHEEAEITHGLSENDKVITTWHPELKDGSAVSCAALPSPNTPDESTIEVVE